MDGRDHIGEMIDSLEGQARQVDTTAGSLRIRWRIWGSGPKLLLLHGNSGSWMHWFMNIPSLSEHFELLVPDIPGFGDSDLPEPPHECNTLATLLLAGIGSLAGSDESIAVVGFSMGGGIAAELSAKLGNRLRHLVLIGVGRGFGVASAPRPHLRRWRRLSDPIERRKAHRHNLDALMLGPKARNRELAEELHVRGGEKARAAFQHETDGARLHAVLSGLPAGLTAIWGEDDVIMQGFRQERVDYFGAVGAQLIFLPDVGHWTQFERPDKVNTIIKAHCPLTADGPSSS